MREGFIHLHGIIWYLLVKNTHIYSYEVVVSWGSFTNLHSWMQIPLLTSVPCIIKIYITSEKYTPLISHELNWGQTWSRTAWIEQDFQMTNPTDFVRKLTVSLNGLVVCKRVIEQDIWVIWQDLVNVFQNTWYCLRTEPCPIIDSEFLQAALALGWS